MEESILLGSNDRRRGCKILIDFAIALVMAEALWTVMFSVERRKYKFL
jgi:hypothetical protein